MFTAFLGGFAGASLAMHPSAVVAIFDGIAIVMAVLLGAMLLWFLVIAAVYYVGIPLWRFVILPVTLGFVAVIGWPFYVIFILVPWCLRRLFLARKDPLWHPFQRSEFDGMSREKRFEWASRYGRDV